MASRPKPPPKPDAAKIKSSIKSPVLGEQKKAPPPLPSKPPKGAVDHVIYPERTALITNTEAKNTKGIKATVNEGPHATRQEPEAESPPNNVNIGDVTEQKSTVDLNSNAVNSEDTGTNGKSDGPNVNCSTVTSVSDNTNNAIETKSAGDSRESDTCNSEQPEKNNAQNSTTAPETDPVLCKKEIVTESTDTEIVTVDGTKDNKNCKQIPESAKIITSEISTKQDITSVNKHAEDTNNQISIKSVSPNCKPIPKVSPTVSQKKGGPPPRPPPLSPSAVSKTFPEFEQNSKPISPKLLSKDLGKLVSASNDTQDNSRNSRSKSPQPVFSKTEATKTIDIPVSPTGVFKSSREILSNSEPQSPSPVSSKSGSQKKRPIPAKRTSLMKQKEPHKSDLDTVIPLEIIAEDTVIKKSSKTSSKVFRDRHDDELDVPIPHSEPRKPERNSKVIESAIEISVNDKPIVKSPVSDTKVRFSDSQFCENEKEFDKNLGDNDEVPQSPGVYDVEYANADVDYKNADSCSSPEGIVRSSSYERAVDSDSPSVHTRGPIPLPRIRSQTSGCISEIETDEIVAPPRSETSEVLHNKSENKDPLDVLLPVVRNSPKERKAKSTFYHSVNEEGSASDDGYLTPQETAEQIRNMENVPDSPAPPVPLDSGGERKEKKKRKNSNLRIRGGSLSDHFVELFTKSKKSPAGSKFYVSESSEGQSKSTSDISVSPSLRSVSPSSQSVSPSLPERNSKPERPAPPPPMMKIIKRDSSPQNVLPMETPSTPDDDPKAPPRRKKKTKEKSIDALDAPVPVLSIQALSDNYRDELDNVIPAYDYAKPPILPPKQKEHKRTSDGIYTVVDEGNLSEKNTAFAPQSVPPKLPPPRQYSSSDLDPPSSENPRASDGSYDHEYVDPEEVERLRNLNAQTDDDNKLSNIADACMASSVNSVVDKLAISGDDKTVSPTSVNSATIPLSPAQTSTPHTQNAPTFSPSGDAQNHLTDSPSANGAYSPANLKRDFDTSAQGLTPDRSQLSNPPSSPARDNDSAEFNLYDSVPALDDNKYSTMKDRSTENLSYVNEDISKSDTSRKLSECSTASDESYIYPDPQSPQSSGSAHSSNSAIGYYDGSEVRLRAHRYSSDAERSSDDRPGSWADYFAGPSISVVEKPEGEMSRSDAHTSSTSYTSANEAQSEEMKKLKRSKKARNVANEITTTEETFVSVLQLLDVDYRNQIHKASSKIRQPVIPPAVLDQILRYLPQLRNLNTELLQDFKHRIKHWDKKPYIADIFVKKGPFLKLYTSYIRDFESMCSALVEARKKYPEFDDVTNHFEASDLCRNLKVKDYMLKPIQRIPQYRLLLHDYLKNLEQDSDEYQTTKTALVIVSEVADHANQSMKYGDNVKKLLEIQASLVGHFEVIKPGRMLLKEGILHKLSRKEMQARKFFLFDDVLLYTTPVGSVSYKVNQEIQLQSVKVTSSDKEDFPNEFSIYSTQRSFTLTAANQEEKEDWVMAIKQAVTEFCHRLSSYENSSRADVPSMINIDVDLSNFKLGSRAPVWIPDARVSMCMLCTAEFTVTFRRHHCRACGKVVCASCSEYKAPLQYLSFKAARVCESCFRTLKDGVSELEIPEELVTSVDGKPEKTSNMLFNKTSIQARFERFKWSSFGKADRKKSAVLKEVSANDESAEMRGYLKVWKNKKWHKQWFVVKGKVLYSYKASEDTAASESIVLLGYEIRTFQTPIKPSKDEWFQGVEPNLLFEIIHRGMPNVIFRTESPTSKEKWMAAIRNNTIP